MKSPYINLTGVIIKLYICNEGCESLKLTMNMRKTGKALLLGAVLSIALSSCGLFGGKKGPCPAYSKADTFKTTAEAVK